VALGLARSSLSLKLFVNSWSNAFCDHPIWRRYVLGAFGVHLVIGPKWRFSALRVRGNCSLPLCSSAPRSVLVFSLPAKTQAISSVRYWDRITGHWTRFQDILLILMPLRTTPPPKLLFFPVFFLNLVIKPEPDGILTSSDAKWTNLKCSMVGRPKKFGCRVLFWRYRKTQENSP